MVKLTPVFFCVKLPNLLMLQYEKKMFQQNNFGYILHQTSLTIVFIEWRQNNLYKLLTQIEVSVVLNLFWNISRCGGWFN